MTESQKRIALWGGVILGIILLLALLVKLGTNGGAGGNLSQGVTSEDHIQGSMDAEVVLVEYSDFQCPFCARAYPMVKQLAAEFPDDQVATVFRHFPLAQIHPNATLAAQASEAAGIQGKFWEYHDMLFNTQKQWADLEDPTEFFVSLANSLGLSTESFRADLESEYVVERVGISLASGNASGVQGTPTFFLNGEKIETPPDYAGLKAAVEQKLAE